MRAQRAVARRDGDRNVELRLEALADVQFCILAAHEHRDLARTLRRFGPGGFFTAGQTRRILLHIGCNRRRGGRIGRLRVFFGGFDGPDFGRLGLGRLDINFGRFRFLDLDRCRRSFDVGHVGFRISAGVGLRLGGRCGSRGLCGRCRVRPGFRGRRIARRRSVAGGRRGIGHGDDAIGRRQRAAGVRGVGPRRRVADRRTEIEIRLCMGMIVRGLDRRSGVGALVALHRGRIGRRIVGNERLWHNLLRHQQGMRELGRGDRAGRDDDAGAHPRPVPHLDRKGHRHADAAMRGGVSGQCAGVQGDARPGDPLHVGHRRAAVDVGAVHLVLLDDAEHAHRGRVTLHARRHRAFREQAVGVVDADFLLVDRNGDDQRALRLGVGFLDGRSGLGNRLAGLRLARLRNRRGAVISGIVVLPVEQGGGVGLGRGDQGTGRREHRDLPEALCETRRARDIRTQKPLPAHALDPQITLFESMLPIIVCCRKGETRSPAARVPLPRFSP